MKILVIHATAGAGHKKAAEAVYNGIKNTSGFEVFLVDALDHSSPLYKEIYRGTYSFLISKIPWAWGIFFKLADIPSLRGLVKSVRRIYNHLNVRKLEDFLELQNFDYIFSSHFLPNEVASYLKRNSRISSKIISIVTDFDVHSIWVSDGIDHYAVASDYTKEKVKSLGVAQEKISVTGIPTDKKFSQQADEEGLRKKFGIKKGIFTILIATGSFGIGPIAEIIDASRDIQVLVVCGHNTKLFSRLKPKETDLIKIFGLVHNMDELMAVSDVMVTKPGGLSISEALVRRLPLVFFNAIPGQETNNIKVLRKYSIGATHNRVEDIILELELLKTSNSEFSTAQKATALLARPNAVDDIISLIS